MQIFMGFATALWLGMLTSISPCPLASNIAAVSFISKKIMHPAKVFISGIAYTLGRVVLYTALGWGIISSILNVPQVAQFLQKYIGKVLGPLLILTGLILLGMITIRLPRLSLSPKHNNKLVESGAGGAFLLGFIFALAFCPISAALFFGSLIPLALNSKVGALLPLTYGIGTGIVVVAFAVMIAFGVTSVSYWFNKITKIEYYMRKVTGIIFLIVGMYYIGVNIFNLF